jgi:prepilin peptidase CpaA
MQVAPAALAVAAAVVLFGLGILFFSRGWLGGGDVKLITATALLIGGYDTPAFLFLMSIIGSVLALVILLYLKLGRLFGASLLESDGTAIAAADRFKVPYGVAVAVAASIVVFLQIQRA